MTLHGVAIFVSAFLLFQVQFLLGKWILPWFGGVPAVWTTCLLFFQVALLAGYAYAHGLARRLSPRAQGALHRVLLVVSVLVVAALAAAWGVPLLPGTAWKPEAGQAPIRHIVSLLTVAVGLPFFVLSATGPLVQAWFSLRHPGASPYRLYALSNTGSLLGLVSYPFAIEAWLSLPAQAWLWAAGFVAFAAVMAACAPAGRPRRPDGEAGAPDEGAAPSPGDRALWFALGGCAAALLLATSNQVSQEIGVVPFLWMVPLALYLLSFILCFDGERWYRRGVFATLLGLGLALSALVMERGVLAPISLQVAVPSLTLFAACMVCHGELARLRPSARHLTAFYLTITASGAAAGVAVGIVAPALFRGLWEYPLALWASAVLVVILLWREGAPLRRRFAVWPATASLVAAAAVTTYVLRDWLGPAVPELADGWLFGAPSGITVGALLAQRLTRPWRVRRHGGVWASPARRAVTMGGAAAAVVLLGVALAVLTSRPAMEAVYQSRSFYGVLQVVEDDAGDLDAHVVKLRHGRIIHGLQYQAPDKRDAPTTYYGPGTGIALAVEQHPRRGEGMHLGVIGLGTGSMVAWARPEDTIRFYEINPDVLRLAGPEAATFTYVRDTAARVEVILGDARLALERELAEGGGRRYDVLAVDAFSSDAIPMHLLTREAVALYLQHLAPDGILAIHISNRYLELEPVVRGLARHLGLGHVFVSSGEDGLTWRSTWALLTRDPVLLQAPAIADVAGAEDNGARGVVWSDQYSNLVRVLKF
jgi:hypothetical protein